MKDLYQILEVQDTATQDEIKRSYRRLAQKYHPDKTFGDKKSEEKFKEVQEAYDILADIISRQAYDFDFKKHFDDKSTKNSGSPKAQPNQEEPVTPETFYKIFKQIRISLSGLSRERINQKALFEKINNLLDTNCISFLLSFGNHELNKSIIREVLLCCNYLSLPYVQALSIKLSRIAGTDNETIQDIYIYNKKKKIKSYRERYGAIAILVIGIFIVSLPSFFAEKKSHDFTTTTPIEDSLEIYNHPKSNALDSSNLPSNDSYARNYYSTQPNPQKAPKEDYSDWESNDYKTGNSPSCYNYSSKFDRRLDNRIEVRVGYNSDVVLKLINTRTTKCIRYVYIRSGGTYNIKNIPEGRYYVKIGYGRLETESH